ncbi:hypothetical protein V6N11_044936 [Hibiscus sabdariffa]|uniref:HTH crp-type domain-containing protein n=1 Tax=Hibiscus sabdariffa TaxID=183260 RepID=A0ABR2PUV6_9ROSI
MVRRHASRLLTEMRKDDYIVKEQPLLIKDMQGGPDYIVLKALDTDSIRIIEIVLGQSIALDYFVSQLPYFPFQMIPGLKACYSARYFMWRLNMVFLHVSQVDGMIESLELSQ